MGIWVASTFWLSWIISMSVQTTLISSLPSLVKASVLPPNPPKGCSASLAWIPCCQPLLHLSIFFPQLLKGLWFLQSAWHRALLQSQVWKASGWLPELPDGWVSQPCLPWNLTSPLLSLCGSHTSFSQFFCRCLPFAGTLHILFPLAEKPFPTCTKLLKFFRCQLEYHLLGQAFFMPMCVCWGALAVLNSVTLWTIACQASVPRGFSRQEHWSGLLCPPPGSLPDSGIEPLSLMSPELVGRFFTSSTTWGALYARTFPLWHFSQLCMWGYLFILFFGCTIWCAGP